MKYAALITLALTVAACGSPTSKGKSGNNGSQNNTANNGTTSNNGTSGSNNGTSASNNGTTVPNNNSISCQGCTTDGVCEAGDSPDACGAGGAQCAFCSDGWVCFDGECIAPPECTPDNCGGCCDPVRGCVEQVDESACGAGGDACTTCDGNETCRAGVCEKPCSETCAGCCDGETCLDGDANGACGAAGAACEQCSANQACGNGTCVDASCADSCNGCCDGTTCLTGTDVGACGAAGDSCMSCGANRSCENQMCVVDSSSRWELVLVSGQMSTTNQMGEPWDVIGSIDPIVEFELVDPTTNTAYRGTSSVVQDDSTPTWNESVLTNVPAAAFNNWVIDVYDSDLDFDDFVCGVDLDISDPAVYQDLFSGAVYTFSCSDANSGVFADINVRLQQ